jgi:spore germination protein YaaH
MLRQRFARAFMWPWAFAFFMAGLFLPKSLLAKDLPRLRSRVFGYIPYWTASKNTWNFQGLTDIALFSVGANDAGQLTSTSFWRSSQAKTILEEAHKRGVSVELAVTNFDPTSLHNLLSDNAAVDKLIGALVQEAFSTQSGDGLSIDFEGLRGADRAVFVSFVTKLRAAMKKVRADSRLSLATPAVDWSKAYDYAALAGQSDTLFIMGYGYHYSGSSNPGPVAPLNCGAPWGNYCLSATVANYLNIVGEAGRGKIVLGLPLYGYDYPADSDKIGAKSLGTGQAVFYSAVRKQVKDRRYEPVSESPWYVYTDAKGQLHQVFYDDEESLGKKLDFVLGQNLGGVGFWALGYEDDSLWRLVEQKMVLPEHPPSPHPGPLPPVEPSPETRPEDSIGDESGAQGCSMPPRSALSRNSAWQDVVFSVSVGLLALALNRQRRRARQKIQTISESPQQP